MVDSHDKGIVLEGPSAGRSQSFEKYQDKDRPLDFSFLKTKTTVSACFQF